MIDGFRRDACVRLVGLVAAGVGVLVFGVPVLLYGVFGVGVASLEQHHWFFLAVSVVFFVVQICCVAQGALFGAGV